jgi:hypothetical protein
MKTQTRLKADILAKLGLPDSLYPIDLQTAIENGGDIQPEQLLYWAQCHLKEVDSAEGRSLILDIAATIAPDDERTVIRAESVEWFVEFGPLDVTLETCTIQRDGRLVAALQNRGDGRLRCAFYEAPDSKALDSILSLAIHPTSGGYVYHDTSNWMATVNSSGTTSALYADVNKESYRSYWKFGIGLMHSKELDDNWAHQATRKPLPSILGVTMLGTYFSYQSLG